MFSETIRKIPKFEKASDLDIMAPIKQFLAGAKFREVKKKSSNSRYTKTIIFYLTLY